MEVTRTFVSKFNEGDEVRFARLFDTHFSLVTIVRLRITNSTECVHFEYLVEREDGERHWVHEHELQENISAAEARMKRLKERENELRDNKAD